MSSILLYMFIFQLLVVCLSIRNEITNCTSLLSTHHRKLKLNIACDDVSPFQNYFHAIDSIYGNKVHQLGTCLPLHKECGWPSIFSSNLSPSQKQLPMLVLSVGLEGAGHHLWTELLADPVFDCIWINGRHYHRDIGDGVPRSSTSKLQEGFREMFQIRANNGKPPCKRIYDAEDSFPTGALRKSGRIFMRPDLIALQQLDGILFNIKYLIIIRNTTDTAMSALRRNFFSNVDTELRTVEHTLTYIEAAIRGIPCDRIFIAHYEHVLADAAAYRNPLGHFLELPSAERTALNNRLSKKGRLPSRKAHKLTQYEECRALRLEEAECYNHILNIMDIFFLDRSFMWPTFAGNGFNFANNTTGR